MINYLEAKPPASARPRGVLVLLHAFPLNARMWEPQFPLAQGGWRILAPEMAQRSSMDDCAGDVIDLLDSLHVDQAVIGGCSMGGYLAFTVLRLAERYVRGLILADTRAAADTPDAVEGRKKMLQLLGDKGTTAVVDEMVPKLLGDTTKRTRPDVVARVRSLGLANAPESVAGMIRALMTRQDSTPLLPKIRVPTLIVVGSEDVITPPPMSEQMHKAIAGSQLAVLPDVGHLSSLEDPASFNDTVAKFLEHRI
ncbi:MAG TPA: alpha/beta fold hydrolase [Vicinamibacterales bacterium]